MKAATTSLQTDRDLRSRRMVHAWALTGLVLVLGLAALSASAQGVYRIVGPDGRVTYSDQPPPAANARPVGTGATASASEANAQLPFQLGQVVGRFPLSLYTSSQCAPCNSGPNLLNARGIPYTEKLIVTTEDGEALKRLSGETALPFMTIGAQQIKGYSDAEWTQFLDAAGYPKTSVLPGNYRRPAAAPLVAARAAPTASNTAPNGTATARPAAPAEIPVAPPVNNPAGIRF